MMILFDFSCFSLNFSMIFLVAILLFCCLDDRDLIYRILLIGTGLCWFLSIPLGIKLLIMLILGWRLERQQ
jgi:uncharacterized oligopeptide transporter (OPT) family protein